MKTRKASFVIGKDVQDEWDYYTFLRKNFPTELQNVRIYFYHASPEHFNKTPWKEIQTVYVLREKSFPTPYDESCFRAARATGNWPMVNVQNWKETTTKKSTDWEVIALDLYTSLRESRLHPSLATDLMLFKYNQPSDSKEKFSPLVDQYHKTHQNLEQIAKQIVEIMV